MAKSFDYYTFRQWIESYTGYTFRAPVRRHGRPDIYDQRRADRSLRNGLAGTNQLHYPRMGQQRKPSSSQLHSKCNTLKFADSLKALSNRPIRLSVSTQNFDVLDWTGFRTIKN